MSSNRIDPDATLARVRVLAEKWTEKDASDLSKVFGRQLLMALAVHRTDGIGEAS